MRTILAISYSLSIALLAASAYAMLDLFVKYGRLASLVVCLTCVVGAVFVAAALRRLVED